MGINLYKPFQKSELKCFLHRSKMKLYYSLTCCSLFTFMQPVFADSPVIILYSDRPPFMQKQIDGSLAGITATPAMLAFSKASISYNIREASPNRRLLEVKENRDRICSIGLYKNPERESYALFSKPISRDGKMIALTNVNLKLPESVLIDTILARSDLHVLVKKDIFYGAYLESKFTKMKAQKIESTAEYSQLLRLIKVGRAQLIFLPGEEALFYMRESGYTSADFRIIKFNEMPLGEYRYIMCSFKVGESVMQKINKGIGSVEGQ
jgi:hypothetical protein